MLLFMSNYFHHHCYYTLNHGTKYICYFPLFLSGIAKYRILVLLYNGVDLFWIVPLLLSSLVLHSKSWNKVRLLFPPLPLWHSEVQNTPASLQLH
jgi:hypothetical protein